MRVPFHRPDIGEAEINEVEAVLRSGWLTTGTRVKRLEEEFAAAVGVDYAVAVSSATAALHLTIEALKLKPGQGVLVPTLTFAATAEVIRYQGAVPILVDCDPVTLNLDLEDARRKIDDLRHGRLPQADPGTAVVGILPVHVGGLMMDMDSLSTFATDYELWAVEDASHAFPAAWRQAKDSPWVRCGERMSSAACFSFYANKTMTTGEGGIVVTRSRWLADRIRLMSLHGLARVGRGGRATERSWDYRIVAPGFKYNLSDMAAAVGVHQLAKAEDMRRRRETTALAMMDGLSDLEEVELPPTSPDRTHAWHLFQIRLRLDHLSIAREQFMDALKEAGVDCSVHWRPLHLHPYYQDTFGWQPDQFPVATREWQRLVSLPLYPSMTVEERDHLVRSVRHVCHRFARSAVAVGAGRTS